MNKINQFFQKRNKVERKSCWCVEGYKNGVSECNEIVQARYTKEH